MGNHTRAGRAMSGMNRENSMSRVRIGIIGSRFQADCVASSAKAMPGEVDVVAVASPTPGHAEAFARRHDIARSYADYRELLRDRDVEMIWVTAPNDLHAPIAIEAARAGKHVVCEKPLCLTLDEADAMIDACDRAGVLLLYAEELFFAPKYVKAKQMADEGAFGRVHLVKQGEKHSGPHADWFWDIDRSGGGALMDLGCHGIAFCWWFLGKPTVKSVYSQLSTQVHSGRTMGDDEAITIIEFETGAIGMVENSWNRPGGMDDSIEVFGDKGQTYADMLMGNALPTYSEVGFGYAVEKASTTKGWTFPVFEEHWNYGFPQELRHFARCVRGKETPISDGATGRVVQEVLYAAYASAGLGSKVTLPFRPNGIRKPIDLWKNPERAGTATLAAHMVLSRSTPR
jgi:myo-inositol 2-dehydrogenase / D-chiro-inositol 1-dehydrogenase